MFDAVTYVCSPASVHLFILLLSTTTSNFVRAGQVLTCLRSTVTGHAGCWPALGINNISDFMHDEGVKF